MSLNGACLGIFDKIQQSEEICEIWGFESEFSETQITSHVKFEVPCNFKKKLNIITGREKSIKYRLESMLFFWHGRTIFCHSVLTKHS